MGTSILFIHHKTSDDRQGVIVRGEEENYYLWTSNLIRTLSVGSMHGVKDRRERQLMSV